MRDDGLYIHHVLDCLQRIQRYCQDGKEAFFSAELVQDAVLQGGVRVA